MQLTPGPDRTLLFPSPLEVGRIIRRPNRFIMEVEVSGEVLRCHTPVTGRIGGLTLDGMPCLLSRPLERGKRTTDATVEAVGLLPIGAPGFQWVGINQPGANGYVAAALEAGFLAPAFPKPHEMKREKRLGSSRIDFLLDSSCYVEVKMPLLEVAAERSSELPWKDHGLGSASPRFERQLEDLMLATAAGQRAAQLTIFGYSRSGAMSAREQFGRNITYHPLQETADKAGVERYRLDLRLSPTAISVGELERVRPGDYRLSTD